MPADVAQGFGPANSGGSSPATFPAFAGKYSAILRPPSVFRQQRAHITGKPALPADGTSVALGAHQPGAGLGRRISGARTSRLERRISVGREDFLGEFWEPPLAIVAGALFLLMQDPSKRHQAIGHHVVPVRH